MFLTHIEQELADEGTLWDWYSEFADPDYAQQAEDRELFEIEKRLDAEYGKAVHPADGVWVEEDIPF